MLADFGADRRFTFQSQTVGARPWLLERINGRARGIYYRFMADDRFWSERISTDVQYCLNTLLSACGYSACQVASGPSSADS